MVVTLLTPRRIWVGVNLKAIPSPLSTLWVIHLPFWMLSPWGKAAKTIFLGAGISSLITALIYLVLG